MAAADSRGAPSGRHSPKVDRRAASAGMDMWAIDLDLGMVAQGRLAGRARWRRAGVDECSDGFGPSAPRSQV
jgi:hypothetical protein